MVLVSITMFLATSFVHSPPKPGPPPTQVLFNATFSDYAVRKEWKEKKKTRKKRRTPQFTKQRRCSLDLAKRLSTCNHTARTLHYLWCGMGITLLTFPPLSLHLPLPLSLPNWMNHQVLQSSGDNNTKSAVYGIAPPNADIELTIASNSAADDAYIVKSTASNTGQWLVRVYIYIYLFLILGYWF